MNAALKADALKTASNLYAFNAPYRIGYLFNETRSGDEIALGMFCDRVEEIDPKQWDYFLSVNGGFYDIRKPRSYNKLMNEQPWRKRERV